MRRRLPHVRRGPDFTVRHRDGREALIEIVGFWTPEYLDEKLRRLRAARVHNLVLVVYRGLGAGGRTAEALAAVTDAPVVWFEGKPRIGPVMEAVARGRAEGERDGSWRGRVTRRPRGLHSRTRRGGAPRRPPMDAAAATDRRRACH